MNRYIFILLFLLFVGCSQKKYERETQKIIISSDESKFKSSSAGNLVATSLRQVHNLDIVFYPKRLLVAGQLAFFENENRLKSIDDILKVYPLGTMDQFYIGNMKGSDVENFLKQRVLDTYDAELEVAGVRYNFMFKGGYPVSFSVTKNEKPLQKDIYYKVAISKFYSFSGETFPSYRYRNSIDRIFKQSFAEVSARDAVTEFLKSNLKIPRLNLERAKVEHVKAVDVKRKSISEIQGEGHLSPYMGNIVTTKGIVTAFADIDWYPGGTELYIQSQSHDGNPRTSEAIHVYFPRPILDISIGDELELTGEVFEEYILDSGLTRTQLRNISSYKVLSNNNTLPDAIAIGREGRTIPTKHISTYNGNVNLKKQLKLSDALDFWESLEGMRVKLKNLTIVGFRGGKESSDPFDKKPHLTLYTIPNDNPSDSKRVVTEKSGVLALPYKNLWNPDIITIPSSTLSPYLDSELGYKIGDEISGEVEGIFHYTKNMFGGGEYSFSMPEREASLEAFNKMLKNEKSGCLDDKSLVKLECRPIIEKEDHSLNIASYNLKNLSANEDLRIGQTGEMISLNLGCPDILGLIEVQDNNGLDFTDGSDASETLNKIIAATNCPGKNYQTVHINPDSHNEGGQPGGNIQVAIIFDAQKLKFTGIPSSGPRQETVVLEGGNLNYNPGRIFPNDKVFDHTRKSLVVQFEYNNESYYVIINHFNSKLGDTGYWNATQPVIRGSEIKRAKLASKVNQFVNLIERRNPQANIVVLGDFNAYLNEGPMRVLEGNILFNLMRTIPENLHYSTNHNGNSQSLDYIFVNQKLKEKLKKFDVLHLNSNYMGRLSDHDPVHASFSL